MKKYISSLFATFLPLFAYSTIGQPPEPQVGPWFTGPLLTPGGYTIKPGHFNIEPYLFYNTTTGTYDKKWAPHSREHNFTTVNFSPLVIVGLTDFMDFQISPQVMYNHTNGQSSTRFGDFPVLVSFQLYEEQVGSWIPAVRLTLSELFPSGKYDKLNPKKLGTDASGGGSYETTLGIALSKLISFGGPHFLRIRYFMDYTVSSPVRVEGFNNYGGGHGTHGKVYPGNEFSASIGLEYTPTLHWTLALDIVGVTTKRNRFSGKTGTKSPTNVTEGSVQVIAPLEIATVGNHSAEQVSLAPAVEYNFSQNIGVVGGVWFTVLGRNTSQYVNGVLAVNIYY